MIWRSPQSLPPFTGVNGRLVALRPFAREDISEEYISWLNDPVIVRYSNQRFRQHDFPGCLAYFSGFGGTDHIFVSIRSLERDVAVGTMTAYRNIHHGTVDAGILIGARDARHRGLGLDAWSALTGWLLGPGGMRKLTCGTLSCNLPMRRLAERSGMTLEGVRRQQEQVDGEFHDLLYFASFREDYRPA